MGPVEQDIDVDTPTKKSKEELVAEEIGKTIDEVTSDNSSEEDPSEGKEENAGAGENEKAGENEGAGENGSEKELEKKDGHRNTKHTQRKKVKNIVQLQDEEAQGNDKHNSRNGKHGNKHNSRNGKQGKIPKSSEQAQDHEFHQTHGHNNKGHNPTKETDAEMIAQKTQE